MTTKNNCVVISVEESACLNKRQGWMLSVHGWPNDSRLQRCKAHGNWQQVLLYEVNPIPHAHPNPPTPNRVYRSSEADIYFISIVSSV